jgi:hypothetical protein
VAYFFYFLSYESIKEFVMFGKFHKYNSRNREYIQTTGINDQIVVKNDDREIAITNRDTTVKPRQDNRSVVLNGLIAWWRLDEGQGSLLNDSSGVGSHATLPAGVSWTDGYLGKTILSTNSAANRINLSSYGSNFLQLSNATFSVSMWFRFTNTTNAQPMLTIQQSTSTNQCLHILMRESTNPFANRIAFTFYGSDSHSNATITDNKWHHFVGTYNVSTQIRTIYIDGAFDSQFTGIPALSMSVVNEASIGYVDFGTPTTIEGSDRKSVV